MIFFFTSVLLFLSCADSMALPQEGPSWVLNGYLRMVGSQLPIPLATVKIRSLDRAAGINKVVTTDTEGFFQLRLPARAEPVELELICSKPGLAVTKVQSFWWQEQQLIELEQALAGGGGDAPQLLVAKLRPYQILSRSGQDLELSVDAGAALAELSVQPLGGKVLSSTKESQLSYRLQPEKLPYHGKLTLVLRALDSWGNRSEVYLPLLLESSASALTSAPGSSSLLAVEAYAYTIANPHQPGAALFLWVDLQVPRPSSAVTAVRVFRGQDGAYRESAYVTNYNYAGFFYRDRSAALRPGQSYDYRFAYEGEQYSQLGPTVSVDLLPSYHVSLLEPADGSVISSGSNILFRWSYRLGSLSLPSGTFRKEWLRVYQAGNWGSLASYPTQVAPLSATENSLSLPLSRFALEMEQKWNISSSLNLVRNASEEQGYWVSRSTSVPSVEDGYASNGFDTFIREVTK